MPVTPPTMTPYLSMPDYEQQLGLMQQNQYNQYAVELASGGQFSDYSNVNNVGQLLGQEINLGDANNYLACNQLSLNAMNNMVSSINTLADMSAQLQQQISALRSNNLVESYSTLNLMATQMLGQVGSCLNSSFPGIGYLFSGTATNVASVIDLTTLGPTMPGAIPIATDLYYLGNSSAYQFAANDDTIVSLDANAASLGFSELITTLLWCKSVGPGGLDGISADQTLSFANDMAVQAGTDIISTSTQVSLSMSTINDCITNLNSEIAELTSDIQDTGYSNVATVFQQMMESSVGIKLSNYVTIQNYTQTKYLIDHLPS